MHHHVLESWGIKYWVAKNTLSPFLIQEIANYSKFVSILPMAKKIWQDRLYYKNIQYLYGKMLATLELNQYQSSKLMLVYEENSVFSELDKNNHSKQLLKISPKIVLYFGNIEFLDLQFLAAEKVSCFNTLHPQHLLQYPKDKKIAFQELLKCKAALI